MVISVLLSLHLRGFNILKNRWNYNDELFYGCLGGKMIKMFYSLTTRIVTIVKSFLERRSMLSPIPNAFDYK